MMNSNRFRMAAVSLVAAVALTACGGGNSNTGGDGAEAAALPRVEAPAGKTWAQTVTATQDGFLMGNPDAPLKLIEFASPTCSHCADFSNQAGEALETEFINSGRVSLELRPFMLNPIDVVVASIASCAGPERFFPLMKNVYATQADMLTGIQGADQAAAQAAMQKPVAERLPAFAQVLGLNTFFEARGLSGDQINQCLADPKKAERWAESTQRNQQQFEVSGTPTFVLNNENIGTMTWDQLKDRLKAAGAR